jgi:hypothetical protein
MTDVPFMPIKGKPAYHLRESTPEEIDTHRKEIDSMERLKRDFNAIFGKKDPCPCKADLEDV